MTRCSYKTNMTIKFSPMKSSYETKKLHSCVTVNHAGDMNDEYCFGEETSGTSRKTITF